MKIRKSGLIRIAAISFLLAIFWSPFAFAQPQITGFSGSLTNGGTLTITGRGFGTKAAAKPFKSDSFEDGKVGDYISKGGWVNYSGTEVGPLYSDTRAHTGKQSAIREILNTGGDWNSAGLHGLQTEELYYSVWFFWKKLSGEYDASSYPNVKIIRVNSGPNFYSGIGSPGFYITEQPKFPWTIAGMNNNGGTFQDEQHILDPLESQWNRIELHIKLSNPAGSTNGIARVWMNGVLTYNHKTGITRTTSEAGILLDNFLIPAMTDSGQQTMSYSTDDVYVDTTQSRVEICTSATWNACTVNKDAQVASSWNDTSITVTVRRDAFSSGQTLYLYVIDADGNVNPNGYLLSSGDTLAPAAPTNLSV